MNAPSDSTGEHGKTTEPVTKAQKKRPKASIWASIRSSSYLTAVGKAVSQLTNADGTPFVAIHESTTLPANVDVGRYKGLLSCHSVEHGKAYRLLSYWKSKAAFETFGAHFAADHAAGGNEIARGHLLDYHAKKTPLWKRYQFWALVITVSTFVGAFISLWERVWQLLENPQVSIEISADTPLNLVSRSGEPKPTKFFITNFGRFAAVSAEVVATLVPIHESAPMESPIVARLSRIEPGTTKEFVILPKLGETTIPKEAPLAYQFKLRTKTKAGLWNHNTFDFTYPPLELWPGLAISPATIVSGVRGRCSFGGVVYSGRAQDVWLDVRAWHSKKPLQSVVVQLTGRSGSVSSGRPFLDRSRRQLLIMQRLEASLDGFRQYDYLIDVTIPGISATECSDVHVEPRVMEVAKS